MPDEPSISVLFVCWGNTCRSVMAEAFGKRRYGTLARFESVGLHPMRPEDTTATLKSLRCDFGIQIPEYNPRGLAEVDLQTYTYVVAMDPEVAEELREFTSREFTVWDTTDPWQGDPTEYKRCGLSVLRQLTTLPFVSRVVIDAP
ncbi:MAG: hypothetical protein DMF56_23810 [Acidobacteria bacterium]|nr:MAG: hypothetical protein DMF56_23810 [Acidobacteriota bacterium]